MKLENLVTRNTYTMTRTSEGAAEITLYGEIVETVPVDWWTGEPVKGDFIVQDEFLEDLDRLSGVREIVLRLNTLGGDAGVSILIHNRLRELSRDGVKIVCVVDGAAMSGGSLILCAADEVRVNPSSLIMIHNAWTAVWGAYNAGDLRRAADALDAYDRAQISIYQRKTGLPEEKISAMMSETTYMTGREAAELGFADEVIEGAEPLPIAASADGTRIFVNGRSLRLPAGEFAPDSIPTAAMGENPVSTANRPDDNNTPEDSGQEIHEEGENDMPITNANELREQYPELCREIEAASSDAAVAAERRRQAEIDAIASLYPSELVRAARYGDDACSAQELAYRAATEAAQTGAAFAAAMLDDAVSGGTQNVSAAAAGPDPDDEGRPLTADERMAMADAEKARIYAAKNNKN